jgi:altronate dehydratase small subunit
MTSDIAVVLKGGLLRLSELDNVYVATGPLGKGFALVNGGGKIAVLEAVTLGHKVAACDIAAGEKVIKYGAPIGSATMKIAKGDHVHVHNMKSDYTPTYMLNETAKGEGNA